MGKEELKPCPFCGEFPYFKKLTNGYTQPYFTIIAEIGCKRCDFKMIGENKFDIDVNMNMDMLNDGISKMIKTWNNRIENEQYKDSFRITTKGFGDLY